MRRSSFITIFIATLTSCVSLENESFEVDERYSDAINERNDPDNFAAGMKRNLSDLPLVGKLKDNEPWSSSYWPSDLDSVNRRWDKDELSPAEKYAAAFSKADVPTNISARHGKLADTYWPEWAGICEGWAAAAVSEPAPLFPVVYNGITFFPGDMEGLMSLLYARFNAPSATIGSGCYEDEIERDEYGRPTSPGCRDTNPGSLHIAVTNFLGLQNKPFIMDKTRERAVWNQPVRGYQITQQEEISKAQAIVLTNADPNLTTNTLFEGDLWGYEGKTIRLTVPDSGFIHIKLHGNQSTELHTFRPGVAVPLCESKGDGLTKRCTVEATPGTEFDVMMYQRSEIGALDVYLTTRTSNSMQYAFNPDATRFVHVTMKLDWITETSPAKTSAVHRQNEARETSTYKYVLELLDDGEIIGGEYINGSDYPDFLWVPRGTEPKEDNVLGVSYRDVKMLFDLSQSDTNSN